MPDPGAEPALPRLLRLALFGQVLLVAAGLRHHLVWGESASLPFLRPLLDAFETACLFGFAWLGGHAWWRGMSLVQAASPGVRRLLWLSLPMLLAAIVVPPFLSADVVDYVMRGRVLALHGANPYVQVATDFPGDPFLQFGDAAWKGFPLPYGPLVADAQGAVAWLAHQVPGLSPRAELIFAVLLFKVLFATCLVLAAATARSIAGVLCPARRDAAFVAVLWNPLLLGECVAQGHNEAFVLLPMLVAVRCLLVDRVAAGALFLGVGVLAKIVPVVLAPLWLVWAVRRRSVGPLCLGALGAALLAALSYVQFFRDAEALRFLEKQSGVTGASVVWALARLDLLGLDAGRWLGRAAVFAAAAAMALRLWRRPEPHELLFGSGAVLATSACCLGIFGPWYHAWWIPLALLADGGFLRRFAVAATLLAPLGYAVWTGVRTLGDAHQWVMLALAVVLPASAAALGRSVGPPRAAAP